MEKIPVSILCETLKKLQNKEKTIPDKIIVEVCPGDRIDDYPIWKAEICERHKVNIMFDDNIILMLYALVKK